MTLVRSARTRLVIASALLGFSAIALMLGLVYWSANRVIDAETRSVVDAELKGLAESYSDLGVLGLARTIDRRVSNSEEPEAIYILTDRFGQSIAGNLGAWPPTIEAGSGWVDVELIRTDKNRAVPISAASIRLQGGEQLLVGRDASAKHRFATALSQSVLLALGVAIAISLVIGWLLTRMVFNRVGELSNTASEIMSGDLSRRMPMRTGGDEFDRLALTLNGMLDRIDHLVTNLRMTTDSLSHDLRSPLTRLRGQIEKLTAPGLTEAEKASSAERALGEVDHILRVFGDLTEISRADAGIGRGDFEPVDLEALAGDVVEFYQPVAAESDVILDLDASSVVVSGHRTLLAQCLSNLLENALRYAPEGSRILVSAKKQNGMAMLSVADGGKGIPQAEHGNVLQPFVTLDPSRTDGTTGLGLALVAAVARLHGGSITLEDNAPGLRVLLRWPCEAP